MIKKKNFFFFINNSIFLFNRAPNEREGLGENVDFTFWSCVYFLVVTCTTVGYGDIVIQRDSSKAFVVCWSLIGIGYIGYLIAQIAEKIKSTMQRTQRRLVSCRSIKKKIAKLQLELNMIVLLLLNKQ